MPCPGLLPNCAAVQVEAKIQLAMPRRERTSTAGNAHSAHTSFPWKHKCQIGAQRQTLPLEISDLLLQGGGGVFMRGKMHPRHEYALVLSALQRGHQGPLDRLLPPDRAGRGKTRADGPVWCGRSRSQAAWDTPCWTEAGQSNRRARTSAPERRPPAAPLHCRAEAGSTPVSTPSG